LAAVERRLSGDIDSSDANRRLFARGHAMFNGTYALLMSEYNAWMNDKLYGACAGLSDEARKANRGAFFGSIDRTLDHILWGDRVWLSRFNGKTYSVRALGEELYADFDERRRPR
jgi:uncharacterized damage-inducible protein DinB